MSTYSNLTNKLRRITGQEHFDRAFASAEQELLEHLKVFNLEGLEKLIAEYDTKLYPVKNDNDSANMMKTMANKGVLSRKEAVEKFLKAIEDDSLLASLSSNKIIRVIAEDILRKEFKEEE